MLQPRWFTLQSPSWESQIQQCRVALLDSLTHSRSWALLEKPPIVQPLKNFPAFYGTRRFITMFTRTINPIHTIPSYLSLENLCKLIFYGELLMGFWTSFIIWYSKVTGTVIEVRSFEGTQNYWGFGLFPSSGVFGSRNTFRKLICFHPQVKGEKTSIHLSPLERANLNHLVIVCLIHHGQNPKKNLSKGPNRVYFSLLTWGRKQIQFPKGCVL
jgi:hypothetical protein